MSNSTRPSSSSSSGYDVRFVVPLEASRRGAHRARVSPIVAALPVAAVVGIVVGAIVLVYWFLGGGRSEVGTGPTTVASPPAATSSPTALDAVASPSEDPLTSSAAGGAVDKSITLDVYNGTTPNVSGLARRAANKLIAAGWTTGKIETWTGDPVTQTTVYYGSAEQKATAQAVVKAIGRGTVKPAGSKAGAGLTVVIGNDFPGVGVKTSPTSRSKGGNRSVTDGGSATPSGAASTTSPQASPPDTGPGGDTSPSPSPGDN